MSCPSHGLCTIPTGESVSGETGVNERKMGFVVDIVEIVEIVVYLDRSKLTFIHNVLVAQRADIEPLGQAEFMSTLFAKDVKLSFKILLIEVSGLLWSVSWTVSRCEDDNWLKNDWFLGERGRSKDTAVARNLAPAHNPKTELFSDCLKDSLRFRSDLGILTEEDVADSILARGRQFEVLIMFKLTLHEFVRDGSHDTCTVTVAAVSADGAPVGHIAQ